MGAAVHLWWVFTGLCAWIVVDLILVLVVGRAARLGEPSYETAGGPWPQLTAAAPAAAETEQIERPA